MNKRHARLTIWLLASSLSILSFTAHAAIPPGYSVIDTISYEYDVEGNRISRSATVSGVAETPIEAQYDAGNRLTQLTLKGQGQNGTDLNCTLSYDLNGNLAAKACTDPAAGTPVTTQYTWDSRNRLTGIQSPGLTASFQYDPLGRRIERTVNGVTTQYLYDGNQAVAELNGNTISASYLTGLAIDEVIARYTAEGERTLLTDALGSVLVAAKEDTSVATAYGYSAYGETQVMGTDEQNPVQYTSRENDGTGLYYYRARYYDPQLKRFIAEDPIGLLGGLNIYAYPFDPISGKDPLGLTTVYKDGNNYSGFPPPGGVCMEAVWMGGYIVGWKPCKKNRPSNNQICTPEYDDPSDDDPDGGPEASDDYPGIDPWSIARDLITPDWTWLIPGGGIIKGVKVFDKNQRALIELAKEAQRSGVSKRGADTLLDWAKEYNVKPSHNHIGTDHWVGGDHIRIGPINHIPVR